MKKGFDFNHLNSLREISISEFVNNDWLMYDLLPDYVNKLKRDSPGDYFINYDFLRTRIKSGDSIHLKLRQYLNRTYNHRGDFYISKTLNDLFGFRIILPNLNENKLEINALLNRFVAKNIIKKFYNKNDRNYRAIHCYFQGYNKWFPWELQIWDSMDECDNIQEHLKHDKRKRLGL